MSDTPIYDQLARERWSLDAWVARAIAADLAFIESTNRAFGKLSANIVFSGLWPPPPRSASSAVGEGL